MNTICGIVPCLMRNNNRENNIKCIRYAAKHYGLQEIAIYDQCFTEADKNQMPESVVYIGNQAEPKGFVKPRNALLQWFYESDYDYALMFDAHDHCTKPTLNDLQTVIEALKSSELHVNVALSTIGIMVSQERIMAKQKGDYKDKVWLLRSKKGYDWLHGTIICNFRKRYGVEPYIDERCDPYNGTCEDVYFVNYLRKLCQNQVQLMPTVTFSEPSYKESTWMSNEGSYEYPKTMWHKIDKLINENAADGIGSIYRVPDAVSLSRIDNEFKQYISPYKSRR